MRRKVPDLGQFYDREVLGDQPPLPNSAVVTRLVPRGDRLVIPDERQIQWGRIITEGLLIGLFLKLLGMAETALGALL